jgi:predicted secreted protein
VPLVAVAPSASALPSGFTDQVVFTNLEQPMAVDFSPDGRVFVAEKSGLIKVFDGLGDTTPTVFADLRTDVFNEHDRGMMSMALTRNPAHRRQQHLGRVLRWRDRRRPRLQPGTDSRRNRHRPNHSHPVNPATSPHTTVQCGLYEWVRWSRSSSCR